MDLRTQSIGASGWTFTNSELRQLDRRSFAGKQAPARDVIDAKPFQNCGCNQFFADCPFEHPLTFVGSLIDLCAADFLGDEMLLHGFEILRTKIACRRSTVKLTKRLKCVLQIYIFLSWYSIFYVVRCCVVFVSFNNLGNREFGREVIFV